MKKYVIISIVCTLLMIVSGVTVGELSLNNPPNVPSEPHPEDGAIDIGIKTHLSWTGGDPDPGDKAVYDIYFGTESEPELLASNMQMPNYNLGILEEYTQYYWKVVARDESQAETSGPIWTFTTNDCDCDPPEKPEGQNRVRNRNRYEYTTRIMNQNHNGLYYQFSWGDGTQSEWIGPYNNNERVRSEHQWQEPGEYQVQARARFQNNLSVTTDEWIYTGWSEPLMVTVTAENEPPSVPTIDGPTSGKSGTSYEYDICSEDPEGDQLYYCINWGDGSSDVCLGPFASDTCIQASHTFENDGTYTIKVKARDINDAESDWATLSVSMPRSYILDSPIGNGLMQRFMNQIRDTLGVCQGGVSLETLSGVLTFDGTNFFIGDVELHFGPTWYITSAISAVDYDKDGELELIIDELKGLVGTEITIEGHYQSDNWISVFIINDETYREPGSPIWSSQHKYRWRYGHRKNQP
jgi:hypothetical protein